MRNDSRLALLCHGSHDQFRFLFFLGSSHMCNHKTIASVPQSCHPLQLCTTMYLSSHCDVLRGMADFVENTTGTCLEKSLLENHVPLSSVNTSSGLEATLNVSHSRTVSPENTSHRRVMTSLSCALQLSRVVSHTFENSLTRELWHRRGPYRASILSQK